MQQKGILEAALRNRDAAENETAIAHATAQTQLAVSSGTCGHPIYRSDY